MPHLLRVWRDPPHDTISEVTCRRRAMAVLGGYCRSLLLSPTLPSSKDLLSSLQFMSASVLSPRPTHPCSYPIPPDKPVMSAQQAEPRVTFCMGKT